MVSAFVRLLNIFRPAQSQQTFENKVQESWVIETVDELEKSGRLEYFRSRFGNEVISFDWTNFAV